MKRTILIVLFACAALPRPAQPCSICGGEFQNRLTLRQECAGSAVVVVGTLSNARLNADASGDGQTDLRIVQIIKGPAAIAETASLTLPRYYPGDGKGSLRGVFFFDKRGGKLTLISGRTIRTDGFAKYLKAVSAFDPADRTRILEFYLQHLDHADPDVAADAFLELARASDREVAQVVRAVSAETLRKLIADPETPRERIGLCAFLLACGGADKDADLLLAMFNHVPEDRQSMRRGLLAGYILLRPREGWKIALASLEDSKKAFMERYAVIGVLEFFHNWRPDENRAAILRAMKSAVASADLADVAAEDLRRWQWWELTDTLLSVYEKASHESPIVRRAILRYALACPRPAAAKFVEAARKRDPDFVADVAESLEADKGEK